MMQESDNGRAAAVASLIAAMFGFGLIPIFLKFFAPFLDPWTVNGVRYSVGALFWLPFLLFLERAPAAQDRGGVRRNVWRDALVPSAVNIVGQAGFGATPYFVPASTLGFVLRLSFLFTLFFGFVFLAEERRLMRKPAFWLGAAVSLAGVVLMFLDKVQTGGTASLLGLVLLIGTALAWGGYAVSVQYCVSGYSARESFGVISIYTSIALVVLMLLFGEVQSLSSVSVPMWGGLMASALIGIAFGHVLYYRGIHRLGPVVASGIMMVTPFVTYLVAAIFLDESLNQAEMIGGVLVVVGGGLLIAARSQVEGSRDKDLPSPSD